MASNYVKAACMDSECHNFDRTKNNVEFVQMVKKTKFI